MHSEGLRVNSADKQFIMLSITPSGALGVKLGGHHPGGQIIQGESMKDKTIITLTFGASRVIIIQILRDIDNNLLSWMYTSWAILLQGC
jgi:hypothetical protein